MASNVKERYHTKIPPITNFSGLFPGKPLNLSPSLSPVGISIALLNPYSQLGCNPGPVHTTVWVMCIVGAVVGHRGLVPSGRKASTTDGHEDDNDQEQDGTSTCHYVIPVGQSGQY